MAIVTVLPTKKSYELPKNEITELQGVSIIQNTGNHIIRVCENLIDADNIGWEVIPRETLRIDGGTLYIKGLTDCTIFLEAE